MPKGAVIVLENARFHKRHDMKQAIQDQHCILEWMPTYYSPDLNPIEKNGHKQRRFESMSVVVLIRCLLNIYYRNL